MDVKEYIDKLDTSKKVENIKHNDIMELGYFNNVSIDKKELLRSVFPYLGEDSFVDALHVYNDFPYPIADDVFVQTLTDRNERILVPIRIAWQNDDTRPPVMLTEKSFNKLYHSYKQFGSQKYTSISLLKYMNTDEKEYINIYYTEDGGVFLNNEASFIIQNRRLDLLGEQLARICIYRDKNVKERNKRYQRVMKAGFRKSE